MYGLVAQLGERRVRNAEVKGSSPSRSTKSINPNHYPIGNGFGFIVYIEEIEDWSTKKFASFFDKREHLYLWILRLTLFVMRRIASTADVYTHGENERFGFAAGTLILKFWDSPKPLFVLLQTTYIMNNSTDHLALFALAIIIYSE